MNAIFWEDIYYSPNELKSRADRFNAIAADLENLWKKMNFPMQSKRTVLRKVENVIIKYDNYLKRPTEDSFAKLF
jgi:hypothetical protein